MLFMGGLIVANAIEITRLHERIALRVLMCFGSDPKWQVAFFVHTKNVLVDKMDNFWIKAHVGLHADHGLSVALDKQRCCDVNDVADCRSGRQAVDKKQQAVSVQTHVNIGGPVRKA